MCERNNSADTKGIEGGGGGSAPGAGAETLLQPMVKTMVRQAAPLQAMEIHGGADIHPAACGGLHAGAGSWQELQPIERSPCSSRFSGGTCDPVGKPCWRNLFLKDCTAWTGPTLEKFVQDCLL